MRRTLFSRIIVSWLLVVVCGCSYVGRQVQDAGTYLGRTVGIVPGDKVYTPEEQRQEAAALISPEQEYHIGRAVAARIAARFKGDTNEKDQQYVQLVGAALLSSGAANETFGGYHFKVIESNQLNAISAPGGYIFVTTGFLKALSNEDQLAAILAHEIGHVSERHGIRMLQERSDFSQLKELGLGAGSLSCAAALTQATLIFSQLVDNLIDTLLESGYSQALEFEADKKALEVMRKTGYPPSSLIGALDAIEAALAQDKHQSGGWFDTHPSVRDRIVKLNSMGIVSAASNDPFFVIRKDRFNALLHTQTAGAAQ